MDNNLSYTLSLKDFFKKTMLSAQQQTAALDSGMNKLQSTLNRASGVIAGVFAFDRVRDFVAGVVMATAAMQGFNNAIMASSRSEQEGKSNLAFLNFQVDRLGLNLKAAQAGYKTFSGSVIGTSIQGERANRVFRQVSEASAILGLSAEQTEGSFLALGQMISKGTVQAEELRGQLAERIPGAFNIGARAMKMSTAELGNAMKNGLIKADDFLVKFGNELEKTFGSKLENATHSVQSNLNKMDSEWTRLQAAIGKSQTGIINSTTSWTAALLKSFRVVFDETNNLTDAFSKVGAPQFSTEENNKEVLSTLLRQHSSAGDMRAFSRYVDSQLLAPGMEGNSKDAFLSKKRIQGFIGATTNQFKAKQIDETEYLRKFAILGGALSSINEKLNPTKDNQGQKTTPNGQSQIGSPVEVSGARPQNITINIDSLIKTLTLQSQTVEGGAGDIKRILSKHLLEVLNDANESVKK